MKNTIDLENVHIELKHTGKTFLGLGRILAGGTVIRSGELPIRPFTATHDGIEYDQYEIEDIQASSRRLVIRTRAIGRAAGIHAVLDHSLDPVWSTRRWDGGPIAVDRMEWVLEAATRTIGGMTFEGFSYHFRFRSVKNPIYYIMDRATWELGGHADGVTLLRQQMGADPKVTIRARTRYSTSACIPFPLNPIMTHDVPRWASEQGFDYQYRDGEALIGLFDRCGLIRTIVCRDPGDGSIRHFDKHIVDAAKDVSTVRKFVGVARNVGDDTDHINAWTRVFDVDQDNVLGEFGMKRTSARTTLSANYWHSFDADTYRKDLLPAAAALGFQQVFIDPFWENDMTRTKEGKLPTWTHGNMCCPHEYEVAKMLGGVSAYRRLAADASKDGVSLISWVGSHQSMLSPYLNAHGNEVIKGMDGRHWYGSGYDTIYGMDLTTGFGAMFQDSIIRAVKATGVSGFLYDSFYNFGWMPVNYYSPDSKEPGNPHKGTLSPHTQWRRLCEIMAAWQKAGLHMLIESLGPWGQAQHGVQGRYDAPGSEPLAYQCSVGIGYSVIPAPDTTRTKTSARGPELYYYLLSNKAPTTLGLWMNGPDGKGDRIDRLASPIVRQANLDYRAVLPLMHTRTVLPDGAGILWAGRTGRRQVLFSYKKQMLKAKRGTPVVDQTTGRRDIAGSSGFAVEALHTYVIG